MVDWDGIDWSKFSILHIAHPHLLNVLKERCHKYTQTNLVSVFFSYFPGGLSLFLTYLYLNKTAANGCRHSSFLPHLSQPALQITLTLCVAETMITIENKFHYSKQNGQYCN